MLHADASICRATLSRLQSDLLARSPARRIKSQTLRAQVLAIVAHETTTGPSHRLIHQSASRVVWTLAAGAILRIALRTEALWVPSAHFSQCLSVHIEAVFARAQRTEHLICPFRKTEVRVAIIDQDRCETVSLPTEVFPGHPIVARRLLIILTASGLQDAITHFR